MLQTMQSNIDYTALNVAEILSIPICNLEVCCLVKWVAIDAPPTVPV